MKLVDLEQQIFVPVVDETHGGVTVEMGMTVGEFFKKCCAGFEPEVVEAIPVEWLRGLMMEYANINTPEHAAYAYCLNNVIEEWHEEQEGIT